MDLWPFGKSPSSGSRNTGVLYPIPRAISHDVDTPPTGGLQQVVAVDMEDPVLG